MIKQYAYVAIINKQTLNQAAKLDNYPIPKHGDILATFAGGQKFSKIDLAHAYQKIFLDEESRELATLNTHKGLYRPTRLTDGMHLGPGIFQRQMEQRLNHIPMVMVRIDDILTSGLNNNDHMKKLVLGVIRKSGLQVKLSKC